nr:AraC family ligand binding domain-containing protein [Clostridia bacterium]
MANKWIFEAKHMQTGRDALYNKQHAHDDCFELLWVREGSGSLLAGDALYRLEAEHIYLIPALMLHYTIPSDGEIYVRSKLV